MAAATPGTGTTAANAAAYSAIPASSPSPHVYVPAATFGAGATAAMTSSPAYAAIPASSVSPYGSVPASTPPVGLSGGAPLQTPPTHGGTQQRFRVAAEDCELLNVITHQPGVGLMSSLGARSSNPTVALPQGYSTGCASSPGPAARSLHHRQVVVNQQSTPEVYVQDVWDAA